MEVAFLILKLTNFELPKVYDVTLQANEAVKVLALKFWENRSFFDKGSLILEYKQSRVNSIYDVMLQVRIPWRHSTFVRFKLEKWKIPQTPIPNFINEALGLLVKLF